MNKFYKDYDELSAIYAVYSAEEPDIEAQIENEEKFPVQADPSVMEAFGEAKSALRKISEKNRNEEYASREEMVEERNEVYKDFNRVYAEVKREYGE